MVFSGLYLMNFDQMTIQFLKIMNNNLKFKYYILYSLFYITACSIFIDYSIYIYFCPKGKILLARKIHLNLETLKMIFLNIIPFHQLRQPHKSYISNILMNQLIHYFLYPYLTSDFSSNFINIFGILINYFLLIT